MDYNFKDFAFFDTFDEKEEEKEIIEDHIDDNHICYSSRNQYSDFNSTKIVGKDSYLHNKSLLITCKNNYNLKKDIEILLKKNNDCETCNVPPYIIT